MSLYCGEKRKHYVRASQPETIDTPSAQCRAQAKSLFAVSSTLGEQHFCRVPTSRHSANQFFAECHLDDTRQTVQAVRWPSQLLVFAESANAFALGIKVPLPSVFCGSRQNNKKNFLFCPPNLLLCYYTIQKDAY